ncbi:thiosulfate sulfurtransferase 18 isoform X2 [Carica papaya]|uniref:thiosulfate sulfurtransferase 18 isoform X2 n=1 Tax=Carica papaya TaxID=3649 RepID=UPI000B8D0C88|nr:thiosulfate sulfurtransferase 18 isoform X2 [Carica papaya]
MGVSRVVFFSGSLFLPLLLFVSFSLGSEVVTVDVLEAKSLLGSGFTYLDIRTEEEYKKGHVDLEKIYNIPYMFDKPGGGRETNPDFLNNISSVFTENDKLLVGCQSGVRSRAASTDLVAAGFKNVRDMKGGYLDWVKHGLSVKQDQLKEDQSVATKSP